MGWAVTQIYLQARTKSTHVSPNFAIMTFFFWFLVIFIY